MGADPKYHRAYYRALRKQVIEAYGGKCACCGIDWLPYLQIHHVNGGGNEHRRRMGKKNILHELRREGFPEGFAVLCANCHVADGDCNH